MKKTQVWYLDFILGFSLFIFVVFFAINFIMQNINNEDILKKEAEKVSNYLVSEGLPKNWTIEDVTIIGLSENYEIKMDKLQNFNFLCINNYSFVKGLFGIKNDFIVFFQNSNDNLINFTNLNQSNLYFGKPNITLNNITEDYNTYTVVRYLIYRNETAEIIQMKLIIFEK